MMSAVFGEVLRLSTTCRSEVGSPARQFGIGGADEFTAGPHVMVVWSCMGCPLCFINIICSSSWATWLVGRRQACDQVREESADVAGPLFAPRRPCATQEWNCTPRWPPPQDHLQRLQQTRKQKQTRPTTLGRAHDWPDNLPTVVPICIVATPPQPMARRLP